MRSAVPVRVKKRWDFREIFLWLAILGGGGRIRLVPAAPTARCAGRGERIRAKIAGNHSGTRRQRTRSHACSAARGGDPRADAREGNRPA